VILLRATGWRISDILNLRYDNCLNRTAQGWWVCGDIPKTYVLHHRVPITEEVAAVVQAVIKEIREKSTPENNPNKLLFVRLEGKRKGRPPEGAQVRRALNRLVKKHNIVGKILKHLAFTISGLLKPAQTSPPTADRIGSRRSF